MRVINRFCNQGVKVEISSQEKSASNLIQFPQQSTPVKARIPSCRQWYPVTLKSAIRMSKLIKNSAKLLGRKSESKWAGAICYPLVFLDSCRNAYRGKVDLKIRFIESVVKQPFWSLQQAYQYDYSKIGADFDFRACRQFGSSCLHALTLLALPLMLLRKLGQQLFRYLPMDALCQSASLDMAQFSVFGLETLNHSIDQLSAMSDNLRASCRLVRLLASVQVLVGINQRNLDAKWIICATFDLAVATVEATRSIFYFARTASVTSQESVEESSWLPSLDTSYHLLSILAAGLGLVSLYAYYQLGDTPDHQYEMALKNESRA